MQEASLALPKRVPAHRRVAHLLRAEYGALNLRWLIA
jgi:hypothetical protein